MKFNYNGLWKTLIDKNMKKKDLIDKMIEIGRASCRERV